MMPDTSDWSPEWEQWFDSQIGLTDQIEKAITGLAHDKSDMFRAALYSAVIEHCAERLRSCIPDEAMKVARAVT